MIQKLDIQNLFPTSDHAYVGHFSDPKTGMEGFLAIHREHRDHPSLGATRVRVYPDTREALRDVLNLSRLMSYKSALAGLPYGGAKAVLVIPSGEIHKESLLRSYAEEVNALGGRFVTGSDLGMTDADVRFLGMLSRHIVGKNVDPGGYTALGLAIALREALREVFGTPEYTNRTFSIQGLGKVGMEFFRLVSLGAKHVYVSDPDPEKIFQAEEFSPNVTAVSPEEIYNQPTDVFSPCALGYSLTRDNAGKLNTKIIAGGANNQLEEDAVADILFERNILYVPDYVVNAGGLISVASEFEGDTKEKSITEKVKGIGKTVRKILDVSKEENIAPVLVSNRMAEATFGGKQIQYV